MLTNTNWFKTGQIIILSLTFHCKNKANLTWSVILNPLDTQNMYTSSKIMSSPHLQKIWFIWSGVQPRALVFVYF